MTFDAFYEYLPMIRVVLHVSIIVACYLLCIAYYEHRYKPYNPPNLACHSVGITICMVNT